MAPVDETERQSTKGGDSDTSDDGGGGAGECYDCARGQSVESPTESSSRKYYALLEIKME